MLVAGVSATLAPSHARRHHQSRPRPSTLGSVHVVALLPKDISGECSGLFCLHGHDSVCLPVCLSGHTRKKGGVACHVTIRLVAASRKCHFRPVFSVRTCQPRGKLHIDPPEHRSYLKPLTPKSRVLVKRARECCTARGSMAADLRVHHVHS